MEGSKTAENCLLRLLCILLCLVACTYGKSTDGLMEDGEGIYGHENDLVRASQEQKLQDYLDALKGVLEGIAPYEDISSGSSDDDELYQSKRGPPSGFMGARGKKLNPGAFYGSRGKKDHLMDYEKRFGAANFYGVRGKKAAVKDIIGQRDSRNPLMGFMGSRGKKSGSPLSGFIGARGKKSPPTGFFGVRGKKVPPAGFMGVRGKRLSIEEESLAHQLLEASRNWPRLTENDIENGLDKRNPGSMGFHAMRGKRW